MQVLFDLIPKWLLAAIVVALSATSCKLHWDKSGLVVDIEKARTSIAQLKQEHSDTVAKAAEVFAATEQANREKEQSLQLAINDQRKKTNEKSIELAALRDSLRVRYANTAATGPNPTPASPSGSATGVAEATRVQDLTELPIPIRNIAGDLIEEAYRADEIRVELLGCYQAYDRAKAMVNTP